MRELLGPPGPKPYHITRCPKACAPSKPPSCAKHVPFSPSAFASHTVAFPGSSSRRTSVSGLKFRGPVFWNDVKYNFCVVGSQVGPSKNRSASYSVVSLAPGATTEDG